MRKFLISLIAVSALFAMTASLASSATNARPTAHASIVRCANNSLYLPPCHPPTIASKSITSCQKTGTTLSFPFSLHAIAGLSSATVRFRGKTIASKTFPGNPRSAKFSVSLSTKGSKPGLFTLTGKVTDTRGKTASTAAHFSICKPAPVFTG